MIMMTNAKCTNNYLLYSLLQTLEIFRNINRNTKDSLKQIRNTHKFTEVIHCLFCCFKESNSVCDQCTNKKM